MSYIIGRVDVDNSVIGDELGATDMTMPREEEKEVTASAYLLSVVVRSGCDLLLLSSILA